MKTKKNMVNLVLMSIVTAATMLGFTACSDDYMETSDDFTAPGKKAAPIDNVPIGRTVLIYMAGKNDLSSDPCRHFLNEDLKEIKEGSLRLKDSDCLLVFVRRFQEDNSMEMPWLARIRNGQVEDSVSVADMGIAKTDTRACDPEVMERVMHYAYTRYAATRDYGLVLWSHSTGWLMEREMAATRGYGLDNGNSVNGDGKWINVPTMKGILERMPHLKFIMADCCHFMCLESLYELRHVTDYVIGSPAEIPGQGAPYKEVVPSLFEGETFYTSIVKKYHASVNGFLPLSVVKTSEMENVAQATANAMQSVKKGLAKGLPIQRYADLTGMIHYGHLGHYNTFCPENNFFFDAGDFISRYASKADYQQWKKALDKAVVMKRIGYKWDTMKLWGTFYVDFKMTEEKFHGVSMFIPQDPSKGKYARYNEDVKQFEWYKAVEG